MECCAAGLAHDVVDGFVRGAVGGEDGSAAGQDDRPGALRARAHGLHETGGRWGRGVLGVVMPNQSLLNSELLSMPVSPSPQETAA
ncbi:hypothetical protein [Streptomyces albogriseolus]|uniref:hypothetical protein n=1 Tax=Streptomyces albogriseolus TaxID=1887 RepID=UPI0033BF8387